MNCFEIIITVINILIAIFVACILFQQQKTNRLNYQLSLFEKRYAIFRAVCEYIGLNMQNATTTVKELIEFRIKTKSSFFLFDDEIQDLIKEIVKRSNEVRLYSDNLKDLQKKLNDSELLKASEENQANMNWFGDLSDTIGTKFESYLRFKE